MELKTQIETFKRIAVWQIGILVAILGAVLKNIWWNLVTKLQLIDTIEKALLLVFKDLRILSNSLSLRLKFRATSPFSASSESGLIYGTTPLFATNWLLGFNKSPSTPDVQLNCNRHLAPQLGDDIVTKETYLIL